MKPQPLQELSRGNTQKGVNHSIIKYLLSKIPTDKQFLCLDAPCGAGEFLGILKRLYANVTLFGMDILPPQKEHEGIHFTQTDLSKVCDLCQDEKFELITSISGIMMFGNTQFFLEKLSGYLKEKGVLIVSNDNSFTVRDRFSYLFLGRLRRFKLLFRSDEGITQYVPQQEIYRILTKNGISVKSVVYTSFYIEDLLFLPLFLFIFPFQWLYIRNLKPEMPEKIKWELFGWKSLLYRHYFFVGEKV